MLLRSAWPATKRKWSRSLRQLLATAAAPAAKYGIPQVFADYREMLKESDIDIATITAAN